MPDAKQFWKSRPISALIERHFSGPSPTCEERSIGSDQEWGLLKTTAITWAGWNDRAHKVLPKAYWNHPELEVQVGDVVVTKAGPRHRVGVSAHVTSTPGKLIVSGKMIGLRPRQKHIVPRLLADFIGMPLVQRELDRATTGMAESQVNFSNRTLLSIEIPVPPASEQKLIANILDAIDDAILETDAVIEKLRTVQVGIIDDLLTRGLSDDGSPREPSILVQTELGPRPTTWMVANLGRFVIGAEYGTNLSLGDSSAGIPVLRMNNIQDGEFDLADMKYAPAHAVDRFRLQRNDVLFNRTNSWEHVGKAAIWRRDEPGPAFASYLVRLHCGDALLPEFLHLWLNWAPVQRAIRQFATPGVQQVNINPTNLRRALIAVPDTLDEQRAIIDRVNGVAAAIEDHRRERAKLSNLREGLRDDLLTGRKPVVAIREAAE